MRLLARGALLASLLGGLGCAHGFNYLDPAGPGCSLAAIALPATDPVRGSFEVVSFNVKMGRKPEEALATLQQKGWAGADVYVLQEVDWRSTVIMAKGLAPASPLNAVYYPASRHPAAGQRQFGVAILSPWPIRSDQKIVLPRLSPTERTQKVALGATVWIAGVPVGVASVHLQANLSPAEVEQQAGMLFGCLLRGECPAGTARPHTDRLGYVVAGDFNTWSAGHVSQLRSLAEGFALQQVGGIKNTFRFLLFRPTLDHVFAGAPVVPLGRGEVSSLHQGSDHHPVRARLRLPVAAPWQGFDRDVLQAGSSREEADCVPATALARLP